VVIGCLDNREARLWVNRQCWKVGTPWIDGGIQEISGVVKVFVPPDSACYECAMTENDYRLMNLRYSCPLLRQEDLLAGKVPTAPTISSMIGGLQTQEALKLIHGMPVAAGEALIYNGVSNQFYKTAFQRRGECLSHDTYPEPVEVPLSAQKHTAAELFAAFHQASNHDQEPLRLQLDRDLVVSIDCPQCATSRRVMRPRFAVTMAEAKCQDCGQLAKPVFVHNIERDSELATELMSHLGIPLYDMLRLDTSEGESAVLLAGDRETARAGRENTLCPNVNQPESRR
jgi:adenylyltransferase/sulfurtransferase